MNITWKVVPTKKVVGQANILNKSALLKFRLLYEDLVHRGSALSNWPNYGKLKGKKDDERHCHLQKGKPTYVCCWRVKDKAKKIIEAYYVGTHEKAPY